MRNFSNSALRSMVRNNIDDLDMIDESYSRRDRMAQRFAFNFKNKHSNTSNEDFNKWIGK